MATAGIDPADVPYIDRGFMGRLFGGGGSKRPKRKRLGFKAYWKQFTWGECLTAYLFLLIPMAIFITFFFIAMGFDFWISFNEWNIFNPPKWVGLQNYNYIFTVDPVFWTAVKNSLEYAFIVVPLQTVLSFTLAVIVNQNIRGKKFFRTVFYFPSLTSSVAIALLFSWMFNQLGVVNFLFGQVGLPAVGWLTDPNVALKSIMGLNIWTTSGTYMIIFLAALQDVPQDLYEAAAIDGATAFQAVRRITVPLIRPAILLIVTTGVIGCIQLFDQAFVLSQGSGGPDNSTMTLVLYIWNEALTNDYYGRAAAVAFVMFAIIFVASLLIRRFIRDESAY